MQNLSSFNSYYELLAGFNSVLIGFETVREFIYRPLVVGSKIRIRKARFRTQRCIKMSLELNNLFLKNSKLETKSENISKELHKFKERLDEIIHHDYDSELKRLNKKFVPLYTYGCLYCFVYIIAAGYAANKSESAQNIYTFLGLFNLLSLWFLLRRATQPSLNTAIALLKTVGNFFLFVVLSSSFAFIVPKEFSEKYILKYINEDLSIVMSFFISALPFIILLFRSYLYWPIRSYVIIFKNYFQVRKLSKLIVQETIKG